jgi:hypothetical protein
LESDRSYTPDRAADLIRCRDDHLLRRTAFHESGHCIAALHSSLPLLRVLIRTDGSGVTQYARRLGPAEIECWALTLFAGPLAEADRFGSASFAGDEQTAAAALAALGLDWSGAR